MGTAAALAVAGANADPSLQFDTVTVAPGATVGMTLRLEGSASTYSGFQVTAWLPEGFSFESAQRGVKVADTGFTFVSMPVTGTPGDGVRILAYGSDASWTGDGELATLRITAPANREPGNYTVRLSVTGETGKVVRAHALSSTAGSASVAHSAQDGTLRLRFAPSFQDLNGNGIADPWEIAHFGGLVDIHHTTDFDLDGLSDYYEAQAGTDPRDADSCVRIRSLVPPRDGGAALLDWISIPGRRYTVYCRAHLGPDAVATPLSTALPATPPVNAFATPDLYGLTHAYFHIEMEEE
jgi:hypothetical protein